jgi:hypothetical protein
VKKAPQLLTIIVLNIPGKLAGALGSGEPEPIPFLCLESGISIGGLGFFIVPRFEACFTSGTIIPCHERRTTRIPFTAFSSDRPLALASGVFRLLACLNSPMD